MSFIYQIFQNSKRAGLLLRLNLKQEKYGPTLLIPILTTHQMSMGEQFVLMQHPFLDISLLYGVGGMHFKMILLLEWIGVKTPSKKQITIQ